MKPQAISFELYLSSSCKASLFQMQLLLLRVSQLHQVEANHNIYVTNGGYESF